MIEDTHDQLVRHLRGIRRIVINGDYGGFSLSDKATQRYKDMAGIDPNDEDFWDRDIPRDDPYLVKIVEELGLEANGDFAHLKIVEIPADVKWQIEEYDGIEWIAEKHRTWR